MKTNARFLKACTVGATALGLLAARGAQAAWEYVPELSVLAETTDNVLVDPDNEESASRTALDLGVSLLNFTQRGELMVRPRLTSDYYLKSEHSDLETTDRYFDIRGNYEWQKIGLGFSTDYSNISALRAELAGAAPVDPDVEGPVDVDTGRLSALNEKRRYLANRVNVDFNVSQRSTFGIELRHADVSYSQQSAARDYRTDFNDTTVAVLLRRRTSQRNVISARAFVSEYSAKATSNSTDSVGVAGEFTRPLTQTWTFDLSAGVQRSDFRFVNPETDEMVDNAETNFTFNMGFRKRGQRSLWNISANRSLDPNAAGHVVVRDQVRAFSQRQITPRLTSEFGVRWFSYEALDKARSRGDRTYTRAELSFEYMMKRTLFVYFGVDVLRQKYEGEGTANSNGVFVGVSYRGLSRRDEL